MTSDGLVFFFPACIGGFLLACSDRAEWSCACKSPDRYRVVLAEWHFLVLMTSGVSCVMLDLWMIAARGWAGFRTRPQRLRMAREMTLEDRFIGGPELMQSHGSLQFDDLGSPGQIDHNSQS